MSFGLLLLYLMMNFRALYATLYERWLIPSGRLLDFAINIWILLSCTRDSFLLRISCLELVPNASSNLGSTIGPQERMSSCDSSLHTAIGGGNIQPYRLGSLLQRSERVRRAASLALASFTGASAPAAASAAAAESLPELVDVTPVAERGTGTRKGDAATAAAAAAAASGGAAVGRRGSSPKPKV